MKRLFMLVLFVVAGCGSYETKVNNQEQDVATLFKSAPLTPPTFSDDFSTKIYTNWLRQRNSPGGTVFAFTDTRAVDGYAARLHLKGDTTLGPSDYAGPVFANQFATRQLLSYGQYRTSVKAASCAYSDEEVVTGIFVYSHDGGDLNNNGMEDNNEIDIEITCRDPSLLWLTIWTDYTDDTHFRKVTRRVDMDTGFVMQTVSGQEGTWNVDDELGYPIAGLPVAGFRATSRFYEMGFEWLPDYVRYFIVIPQPDGNTREITLWEYTNASFIPQNSAYFMMNIWHSDGQWDDDGGLGDYPKKNSVLSVDWFKYWEY